MKVAQNPFLNSIATLSLLSLEQTEFLSVSTCRYPNTGRTFLSHTDHSCQILAPWDENCGCESLTAIVSGRVLELEIICKDNLFCDIINCFCWFIFTV